MIIFKKIEIQNFLSVGAIPVVIDLDTNKKTLFTGKNGSGKSTVASAILFALTGDVERDIVKSRIVNNVNNRECLVKLTFVVGSKTYDVFRGINPDKFEVYENGEMLKKNAGSAVYQKELYGIIQTLPHMLTNLVYMSKTCYQPFMKMKSKERRQFVEEILDTKIFNQMAETHKKDVKALDDKHTEVEAFLKAKNENLQTNNNLVDIFFKNKEMKINNLTHRIETLKSEWSNELKKRDDNIISLKKQLDDSYKENPAVKEHYEKINNAYNQIKHDKDKIAELNYDDLFLSQEEFNHKCILEELEKHQEDFKPLNIRFNNIKSNGERENNLLKKLKNGTTCPTCSQDIPNIQIQIDKQKLVVQDIFNEFKECNILYTEMSQKIDNVKNDLRNCNNELDKLRKTKHMFDTYISAVHINTNQLKVLEEVDVSSLQNPLTLRLQRQLMQEEQRDIDGRYDGLIKSSENEIISLKNESCDDILSIIDKVKVDIVNKENELNNINKELIYAKYMTKYLKDDGIKATFIKKYVPFLNSRVNNYLSKLGLNLEFFMDENFDELLRYNYTYEYSYDNLSEGEKQRVDLSLMFAFRDIAKMRNIASFNIFILDDMTGALDINGVNAVLEMIEENQEDITTLFISHDAETYSGVFDDVYVFSKENGFTTFERI